MGAEISKCYPSYKSQTKDFKLFLNFFPMVLTKLLTLKGQCQGHSDVEGFYLTKEASQFVTIKCHWEIIYGESNTTITFGLE